MSFPFEVEMVAGSTALARREALLGEGRGYPIIAGSRDSLDALIERHRCAGGADACLEGVGGIDVDAWLARRVASDPDYYAEEHGEWPAEIGPTAAFVGAMDIVTQEPLAEAAIVLVPATESWRVPCLLGYGDWNECPAAVEHAAILRRWEERYGATLVTMTHDIIELAVERPVASRGDALVLAREQYVYCADIVQQGAETIEGLAAALLNAPVWYFWWD